MTDCGNKDEFVMKDSNNLPLLSEGELSEKQRVQIGIPFSCSCNVDFELWRQISAEAREWEKLLDVSTNPDLDKKNYQAWRIKSYHNN